MRGKKDDKGDAWGAVLLKMALPAVYIRVVYRSISKMKISTSQTTIPYADDIGHGVKL